MARVTAKRLVLIVDDTPENIDVLAGLLRGEYEVKAAVSGEKALKIVRAEPRPDMILLDVVMPGLDGYEVCRRLKADPATSDIPVIFVTARRDVADEEQGLELGAVDYITKPISPAIVRARVHTHLALYDQSRELTRRVEERTRELHETRLQVVQRLGRAAEYRDNETGLHVIRVSHYARLIAVAYGGNPAWLEMIFDASPMHDIGKIGIPDRVLLKPGKLEPDEWALMKTHAELGAEIIGDDPNPLLRMARSIALTHHERWDGRGYPYGLAGTGIPLEGRILAIADVFDALTSERAYKKAWPLERAVDEILASSGSHFDPALVPLFRQVLSEVEGVMAEYAD